MPSFKIQLMGPITDLVGRSELEVQTQESATLSAVVEEVERAYGKSVKNKILAPDGDFHPYVLVSVNGIDVRELNGIDTRLNDGDKIILALLITGG